MTVLVAGWLLGCLAESPPEEPPPSPPPSPARQAERPGNEPRAVLSGTPQPDAWTFRWTSRLADGVHDADEVEGAWSLAADGDGWTVDVRSVRWSSGLEDHRDLVVSPGASLRVSTTHEVTSEGLSPDLHRILHEVVLDLFVGVPEQPVGVDALFHDDQTHSIVTERLDEHTRWTTVPPEVEGQRELAGRWEQTRRTQGAVWRSEGERLVVVGARGIRRSVRVGAVQGPNGRRAVRIELEAASTTE